MVKKRYIFIQNGNFQEGNEQYMESFKKRIQDYELALEHNEIPTERQKIESEFSIMDDPAIRALIDEYNNAFRNKEKYIKEKERKSIARNKQKIRGVLTIAKLARLTKIKPLLRITEERYKEISKDIRLLKEEFESDMRDIKETEENLYRKSSAVIDEICLYELISGLRSNRDKRYTTVELESILGKKRLSDAVQDTKGIGNIFQRLLRHLTTEEEGEKKYD